ncbi:hypothetical protein [Shimwellia blattae]|uniref:Putative membran protein n=1 Tax=Shimwellia blattae (strain ATCC 29907 / DSM 4481 / JCM 1650 / NBRC 105725 / CDC 9005-74) TaxID=630626 RepID=I2BDQ7_SHIBC|nr:hypothetical protein [Shimwellia blattae]AFJ48661.1 putative membran protein [Shimwellia blattae DSM 4481 = NBRC 105725]GAB81303.1 hypothetical protein EB105725_13_00390 [Shimwellia blattae DSM 4481 = NBRC 105725]VDY66152.1 Uncharacterised protein [Shimwellia blattae]VEC27129.1 Uncharacterised protein [Shimwellia blattae]
MNIKTFSDNTKIIIPCIALVLVAQAVGKGMSAWEALPGALVMFVIIIASLQIKDWLPKLPLPAFAWATLLALLLSMPYSPVGPVFMKLTDKIDFLSTTTPLLAFAGLSVGNSLDKLKSLSWKIVIISLVVFTSAFFGAALVAQTILKFQHII